jgi:hypothetical protein
MSIAAGARLGSYEVVAQIGSGGIDANQRCAELVLKSGSGACLPGRSESTPIIKTSSLF